METLSPTPRTISQSETSQSETLAELKVMFLVSQQNWWSLYTDNDCWINLEKRQAMLLARCYYQQAKLNFFFSLRFPDWQHAGAAASS